MSPYDDPAVSAGEIADNLDQLRLQKQLGLFLEKHVDYDYSQYEPNNQLKEGSNKLEEVNKHSAYVKRMGQGREPS